MHSQPYRPPRRSHLPAWWRHLADDDKDGIYNKAAAALWALVFLRFTPSSYSTVLDLWTTVGFTSSIILGAGLGIFGRIRHTKIEIIGLLLVLGGLAFFAGLQALFILNSWWVLGTLSLDRLPLMVLALAYARTFYGRQAKLLRPIMRELHEERAARKAGGR